MQSCSHQYYFRPTNSSAFQCMVTVILRYKRYFLLPITAKLEASPNPEQLAAPPHAYSTQLSLAGSATIYLQRLEFSYHPPPFGGLAMTFLRLPSLSTILNNCFGGNNLLTGAHKGNSSFWKQAAQEELRVTTNCSSTTKSKTQSQPDLPVGQKHKERNILRESSQTGMRQTDPLGTQL